MRITSSILRGHSSRMNSTAHLSITRKSNSKSKTLHPNPLSRSTKNANGINKTTGLLLTQKASALQSAASTLSADSANNIYSNARKTGSKTELLNRAKTLVNGHNDTLSSVSASDASLSKAYRRLLANTSIAYKDALAGIGITVGSDSKLSINEDVFQKSTIDDIEKALGKDSDFTSRVEQIAGNIAKYSATDTSSAYGTYGIKRANNNYLASLLSGRFNFWG
ncbi:MAG: hypothetical protein GX235_01315 [Clostridiales bacterium]|nr:hypothetical protein [Clostridiales bacterium]